LTERVSEVSSTNELDSFEEDLTSALKRYGVALEVFTQNTLSEHREYLEEKESREEQERYTPAARQQRDSDVSDEELKSLFATLLPSF